MQRILSILFCLFALASMSYAQNINSVKGSKSLNNGAKSLNNALNNTSNNATGNLNLTTLKGNFESKKGVMVPESCHCYNVGRLTLSNGDVVIVCFDELPNSSDLDVNCQKIQVDGIARNHTAQPSKGGPCTGGTMELFYVVRWRCL